MAVANINEFISSFKTELSRPCNFEVEIIPPAKLAGAVGGGSISKFRCEQAELPARAFVLIDQKTYGPVEHYPVQNTYNKSAMTFICGDDMKEKTFFDAWMEIISGKQHNGVKFDFEYKVNYCTDIKITQMSLDGKESYTVYLVDAFPAEVYSIPLSWAQMNDYNRLNVVIAYRYFKVFPAGSASGELSQEQQRNQLVESLSKKAKANADLKPPVLQPPKPATPPEIGGVLPVAPVAPPVNTIPISPTPAPAIPPVITVPIAPTPAPAIPPVNTFPIAPTPAPAIPPVNTFPIAPDGTGGVLPVAPPVITVPIAPTPAPVAPPVITVPIAPTPAPAIPPVNTFPIAPDGTGGVLPVVPVAPPVITVPIAPTPAPVAPLVITVPIAPTPAPAIPPVITVPIAPTPAPAMPPVITVPIAPTPAPAMPPKPPEISDPLPVVPPPSKPPEISDPLPVVPPPSKPPEISDPLPVVPPPSKPPEISDPLPVVPPPSKPPEISDDSGFGPVAPPPSKPPEIKPPATQILTIDVTFTYNGISKSKQVQSEIKTPALSYQIMDALKNNTKVPELPKSPPPTVIQKENLMEIKYTVGYTDATGKTTNVEFSDWIKTPPEVTQAFKDLEAELKVTAPQPIYRPIVYTPGSGYPNPFGF
jgi:hypothetical protein